MFKSKKGTLSMQFSLIIFVFKLFPRILMVINKIAYRFLLLCNQYADGDSIL